MIDTLKFAEKQIWEYLFQLVTVMHFLIWEHTIFCKQKNIL